MYLVSDDNYRYYSMKEWNKFSQSTQEHLVKKFHVILTDHKTKREKALSILDIFAPKNINKVIDRFQKAMNKLDTFWKKWDRAKGAKVFGSVSKEEYDILWGSGPPKRDYSALIGRDQKRDYSFLTGSPSKKKKRRKRGGLHL